MASDIEHLIGFWIGILEIDLLVEKLEEVLVKNGFLKKEAEQPKLLLLLKWVFVDKVKAGFVTEECEPIAISIFSARCSRIAPFPESCVEGASEQARGRGSEMKRWGYNRVEVKWEANNRPSLGGKKKKVSFFTRLRLFRGPCSFGFLFLHNIFSTIHFLHMLYLLYNLLCFGLFLDHRFPFLKWKGK